MLQNPMVMQQMKVMMQDPSVKQRMQKMLSKLGADSGIDPALADPAMLDKLFERMQAPPAATRAPARPLACAFLHSCCYRARCRPHRRLSPATAPPPLRSSCIALRHTPRNLATACAVRRSDRLPARPPVRRRTRRCSRS